MRYKLTEAGLQSSAVEPQLRKIEPQSFHGRRCEDAMHSLGPLNVLSPLWVLNTLAGP